MLVKFYSMQLLHTHNMRHFSSIRERDQGAYLTRSLIHLDIAEVRQLAVVLSR